MKLDDDMQTVVELECWVVSTQDSYTLARYILTDKSPIIPFAASNHFTTATSYHSIIISYKTSMASAAMLTVQKQIVDATNTTQTSIASAKRSNSTSTVATVASFINPLIKKNTPPTLIFPHSGYVIYVLTMSLVATLTALVVIYYMRAKNVKKRLQRRKIGAFIERFHSDQKETSCSIGVQISHPGISFRIHIYLTK